MSEDIDIFAGSMENPEMELVKLISDGSLALTSKGLKEILFCTMYCSDGVGIVDQVLKYRRHLGWQNHRRGTEALKAATLYDKLKAFNISNMIKG